MAFKFNPFTGNFDEVNDDSTNVQGPASSTDNAIARFDGTTGKLLQNSQVTISDTGDMIIAGDLTVNGTTTTINTATLDVEDQNISVNINGNDASAEGAGLTIVRTGSNGSFVYDSSLVSLFKIGVVGDEDEIATVSREQTLTNKNIDADNNTITDIRNANIAAAAAIEMSKLEALTAFRALATDGSGEIVATAITDLELGFLTGVNSNVQTQIDARLNMFGVTSDNALIRADGIDGRAVQTSTILLGDLGELSSVGSIQFNTGVLADRILDEDNLGSDSDTALATQQSIKAYVDSSVASGVYNITTGSGAISATANLTYLVDVSGGSSTVTLPAPAANTYVRIKDSEGNANTNNITVNPNAAETIDGAASIVLQSDYEAKTFVSDGINWFCF